MKQFITLLVFALIALVSASDAQAYGVVSETSAKLVQTEKKAENNLLDSRVKAVENVFKKYNSPLAAEAANYVKYADMYGVDWRLLPSIAGLESSFGIFLMPGSHNAYGWGGGHIYFSSWEEGIATINKALRENYMDRWGATDVWSIGPIYAESPTWAVRVNSFMLQFEAEYQRLSTFAVALTI